MMVDSGITQACDVWISHGIHGGSCTELLLRGRYEEAFKHAHPLIHPHWEDHIKYIESLPIKCRNENYDSWNGIIKQRQEYEKLFII